MCIDLFLCQEWRQKFVYLSEKSKFCGAVPNYKLLNSLILALSTMSNKDCMYPETTVILQLLALVDFTVVYISADLGAVTLCQLDDLPFPEWVRDDTASDIKISQMMPSLRPHIRQLCPGSAPLPCPKPMLSYSLDGEKGSD